MDQNLKDVSGYHRVTLPHEKYNEVDFCAMQTSLNGYMYLPCS